MVGEAGFASVMAESLKIYHRYLSLSKPRLKVFIDRILFESNTTNCFLAFTIESTTLKAPIAYFEGMRNCVDDFSWKVSVFSMRSLFLDYANGKQERVHFMGSYYP